MLFDERWLIPELLARLIPGYPVNPGLALAAAAERLGVGPVPLFDCAWYSRTNGIGSPADAFRHYMAEGARQGLDPHPLFATPYYLAQAPEAAANPLMHFLETGGPTGLDCHPLFFSAWYRARNADVVAAGLIPLVHFLQYGQREARDPNPMFSVRFYLEQLDDQAAAGNPLMHYVLTGAAQGLLPHPGFQPDAILRRFRPDAVRYGALAAYLEITGRDNAVRTHGLHDAAEEPGIVPPPLPTLPRPVGEASQEALQLLRALGADALKPTQADSAYYLAKLETVHSDASQAAELAAGMQDPGAPGLPLLLQAAGLIPAVQPAAPPDGRPTPLILDRYLAHQHAAARRFRLDAAHAGTVPGGPRISVIMPVYRSPLALLERAVLSVLCQTHADWELCLVDDCSAQPGLTAALARLAAMDSRIKLAANPYNAGISAASNRALGMASGAYVGLLDHDDMLTSDALAVMAAHLRAHPDAGLAYSDECLLDADDRPHQLFTKPDWSPLLLTSVMYTGHFSVYRKDLVQDLGGFRSRFDLSQDYDLALRAAERDIEVVHVKAVLYGWRMVAGSASVGGKPDARLTNVAALQSAMDRRGWAGTAVALPRANRAVLDPPDPAPLVSIIIPSDDPAHIRQAVMSIVAHTDYAPYEIVVVAGAPAIAGAGAPVIAGAGPVLVPSRGVRFVRYDQTFNFSDKCNKGAAAAKGAFLVFFNDDVRVLSPGWLGALLEALRLPGVGAAGPKLLYSDHTIQHAGMITGSRRLVSTAFHAFPAWTGAHFNLAQSLREVSLLSGACLALPAALFNELGGFDAVDAPIAHSDVELCLRVRQAGLYCVYTPHAVLTHIGHVSLAGAEQTSGFRQDKADATLMRRFGKLLEYDPFFPPPMQELLAIGDQYPFRYYAADRPDASAKPDGDALIVSHDLTASGAPKVVFDMARALLRAGRQVVVLSAEDGPFRARLLALGADVIIDPAALLPGDAVIELARNFDLVIGNTVLCWRLAPALARFTRVYLYAHETELAGQLHRQHPQFSAALARAARLWAGSARAASVLRGITTAPVDIMEYGVEAPRLGRPRLRQPGVTIAVLATIEPRKGRDLALIAFGLLPRAVKQGCRLVLHGRVNDTGFGIAIRGMAAGVPAVTMGDELDLEGYRRALSAADIVLCPSRDDTLPLVSLNALAEGKILVCTGDVGTSAYVEDGVSAFVASHGDPALIAAALERALAARGRWAGISAAARLVFREQFSEARFARRLLGAVGAAAAAPALAEAAE